jgi:polygalacturonase
MLAREKLIFKLLPVLIYILTASVVMAASGKFVDATKAGGVGDGVTVNTVAIRKAIDDCSADGGGTIQFPAGHYLTGTIQIKNHVTLRLEKDATLLGSTDVADYRNLDPFIDGSGNPMGHALIVAVDAKNVGIEGVTIRSRDLGMPNNDGINIDSSENVRVRNCDVISGDDALVIKLTTAK